MKSFGKIVAIVCGALAVIVVALQIVLDMPFVSGLVDKYSSEFIDGRLEYSRLNFSVLKNFPKIRVSIDSLSITYPHDRFAEFDNEPVLSRMQNAGRGEESDTLICFDSFTAAVSPLRLLSGRIRLCDASLSGLAVYAHKYDSTANWSIFKASDKPEDSLRSVKPLPWISVGRVKVDGHPELVYTDISDTVFLAAVFNGIFLKGGVKADLPDKVYKFKDIHLHLDSLKVRGRLPADTLALSLDYFDVSNPLRDILTVGLAANAVAFTNSFGRLRVPVTLDARAEVKQIPGETDVKLPELHAELAHIPLDASGLFTLMEDSTYVKLRAAVKDCDLGTILEEYGPAVSDLATQVSTDARLTFTAEAEGYLSDRQIPSLTAKVFLPRSRVYYRPMDLLASIGLDAEGSSTSGKYVKAAIRDLSLNSDGIDLSVSGKADDLLGGNPGFDVHANGHAILDSLVRFLPEDKDIEAGGRLDISIDARADKQELMTYRFNKADIKGKILSDHLFLIMEGDSLDASLFRPEIHLSSNVSGLNLSADMDSVFFSKGASLNARTRGMKNAFRMYKVEERGKYVPRLAFETDNRSMFLRSGKNRIGLFGANVGAAIQMRSRSDNQMRSRFLDSLHRAHPGVPRDSLLKNAAGRRGRLPSYMKESDFADNDLDISLDSTITKYLKRWKPSGNLKVALGFVSTPTLPLRTRISSVRGNFTDNEVHLDSIVVVSGTSDISAKGRLSGLRRALVSKGMLRADMELNSRRINLNELLVALDNGKTIVETDADSETEGSYVVDSIAGADISGRKLSLLVVPANVNANLGIRADHVDYSDIAISPFRADLKMQDRTLQLTNADAQTNLGAVSADAFYSTKSKKDISMGVDLRLSDISAQGIIHMLPTVDDMMPALKSFEGNLGLDLSATTQLDTNMNVVIPTLDGILRISGKDLTVKDAGDLKRITRLLLFKNKNIGDIQNMSVDAVVHDSKVDVFPFELSVDRYKLALRGMQSFDKKMNYHVSVMRSPFLIPFGINIYGYTDNWRFSLGPAKYREGKVPVFSEQLDTVQVNTLQSIRDVYKKGVRNAREQVSKSRALAEKSSQGMTDVMSEMSRDEFDKIDAVNFEMTLALAEAELDAEIEEALKESAIDINKLLEEYEAATEDKSIDRKISRLKKKN